MYKEPVVARSLNIILIHNFLLSTCHEPKRNDWVLAMNRTGVAPALIHNPPTQSSMETCNYRNYRGLGRGVLQDLSAEVPFKPCQKK